MDVLVSELGNMSLSIEEPFIGHVSTSSSLITKGKVSGKTKNKKGYAPNIHFIVEEISDSQINTNLNTNNNETVSTISSNPNPNPKKSKQEKKTKVQKVHKEELKSKKSALILNDSLIDSNDTPIENIQSNDKKKKELKQKEPKPPKEPNEPKPPKEPKEPKPPKEPKQPKQPKEPKEPKQPKEKKIKEPKEKPIRVLKQLKDKHGRRIRACFLIDTETKKPVNEIETSNKTEGAFISTSPNHSTSVLPVSIENNCIPSHLKTDIQQDIQEYNLNLEQEPLLKKRGRKPKGGKLILKNSTQHISQNMVANVILHLRCSLTDLNEYTNKINKIITDPLEYNPDVPPDISAYNENTLFSQYESNIHSIVKKEDTIQNRDASFLYGSIENININTKATVSTEEEEEKNVNMKEINSKLKNLKISLYKNQLHDKKSACFWCTYEYDNPTCYIPKYEMDGQIVVYGSFCKPECAVAYLMKENIDDSTKFERYHLLNQIYSKIFDYKKNIKPAPNPYYLLDKFYGNLTIQEYRKLSKTDYILMTIDKPLTRILPELYEETEDNNMFNGNSSSNSNLSVPPPNVGVYKVKRQSEKVQGPSKSSIIRDKFGLA